MQSLISLFTLAFVSKINKDRLSGIDFLRGFAVWLMIIYHFFYDLNYFNYIDIKMNVDIEWRVFRYIIISLFLFTVGISLNLSHKKNINLIKLLKKIILLGLASLSITVVTYFVFPNTWIYFGILHFILVASVILLPIRNKPTYCFLLALIIFIAYMKDLLQLDWSYSLINSITPIPYHSEDFVPLFPWLIPVLIGMICSSYRLHQVKDYSCINTNLVYNIEISKYNRLIRFFTFFGRNALLMYLIHQPIMFLLFNLFS